MDEVDPIEEIHEIRRKLMEKAGGTPESYVRNIMEQQKLNPEGLLDLSEPKTVRNKPCRKPTKTATKTDSRKSGQRRKAVAP